MTFSSEPLADHGTSPIEHQVPVSSGTQTDFELGFFAEILAASPDHLDALQAQASTLSRLRRFQDAAELDRRLAELRPEDAVVRYNLACSLAQCGRREDALRQLKRAVGLGYNDWLHLEADRDLDPLRSLPAFKRLVRGLRSV